MNMLYLIVAVAFEVAATSALKETDGFTRLWPTIITIVGYSFAFYFLALTLRTMPVGVVYALWSGAGIVLISLIGWLWFRQTLDLPAIIGIALILIGVLVVNLFSKAVPH